MKILITANSMWNIVNFRKDLIEALLIDQHEVIILAPEDHARAVLKSWGCKLLHINMDSQSLNPFKNIKLFMLFYIIFKKENPDIIWSFTIKNNIFGSLAANMLNMEFVPNISGLGSAFLSNKLVKAISQTLYKIAFKRNRIVFFQNEDDMQLLLKMNIVNKRNARVIPGSGINLSSFQFIPLAHIQNQRIIMVSRVIKDKGVREFLEASRNLKKKYPSVKFSLIGELNLSDKRSIEESELTAWHNDKIGTYRGFKNNMADEFASSSLVVLPSYREGAPRVLIEAASLGRPCVTTDTAGCRSVVDDCKTGFLCEPKNSKSLEAAIQKYIELPQIEKNKMGLAARRKMEKEFNVDFVINNYFQSLEIGNSGSTRSG
jgi:glycosyltransferase involved in cell wall biosynthesis